MHPYGHGTQSLGIERMWLMWLWLILAAAVALVAIEKQRNGPRWFIYAMVLLPVAIAHLSLIHLGSGFSRKRRAELESGTGR